MDRYIVEMYRIDISLQLQVAPRRRTAEAGMGSSLSADELRPHRPARVHGGWPRWACRVQARPQRRAPGLPERPAVATRYLRCASRARPGGTQCRCAAGRELPGMRGRLA